MTRAIRRAALVAALGSVLLCGGARAERPFPILFVTQVPNPYDFATRTAVFANHTASVSSVARGGDLWLLLPDGGLVNLTAGAGYGSPGGAYPGGFQGAGSIAVRDPAVDWSGERAVFAMLVGAPATRYAIPVFHWQLYEVTNLGAVLADPGGVAPVVEIVPNQPAGSNNVEPVYLSDGRILFASDRPFNGAPHLHPQRDEYESTPVVSGLWALDPASGALEILDHAPSGDFGPIVDSFGRVVFTRWDHLQRDQQADPDRYALAHGQPTVYGTFDYASEAPGAPALDQRVEVYPEPRANGTPGPVAPENGHAMNQFFPWMMSQDGTGLETLNHIGRHELLTYFEPSRTDDPDLEYFLCGQNACGRYNDHDATIFLQIQESTTAPGLFFGTESVEFGTHASGRLLSMPGEPTRKGDEMALSYVTHPSTLSFTDIPPACHSGLYRDPLPLADGSLVAVWAGERSPGVPETRQDANEASWPQLESRYRFRLVEMAPTADGCAGYVRAGSPLTPGLHKTLWFWSPDDEVRFTEVALWELDPVEVRPRSAPVPAPEPLPAIEAGVLAGEGVDAEALRQYLVDHRLALVVSRDVTTRDEADRQQPFNLRVPGGTAETTGSSGTLYDVEYLQLLQGDMIRGIGGVASPAAGRRVLARVMHDSAALNPPVDPTDPPGSVEIADDGSMAAFVPAHRAMTWQLTTAAGAPVVRERYWLTFQAGEMRVCTSCHGLNSHDQAGAAEPVNEPQALHQLLQWWKTVLFHDGFEGGTPGRWSAAAGS